MSIALRKKKNLTRQERSLNSSAVARRVTSVLRFKARPSSEQSQVSHSQTDSTQFQSKPNADYISLLPIADEHELQYRPTHLPPLRILPTLLTPFMLTESAFLITFKLHEPATIILFSFVSLFRSRICRSCGMEGKRTRA